MPPNAAAIAQRQRKVRFRYCWRDNDTEHCVLRLTLTAHSQAAGLDTTQIIDYQNLPPPVRYEELQREALSKLSILGILDAVGV